MAMAGGIRRGQARGAPRGLTWRELAGTMGCPVSGSGDAAAVRPCSECLLLPSVLTISPSAAPFGRRHPHRAAATSLAQFVSLGSKPHRGFPVSRIHCLLATATSRRWIRVYGTAPILPSTGWPCGWCSNRSTSQHPLETFSPRLTQRCRP